MRKSRFFDWQPRLITYLAEAGKRPFEDGVNDCALWLAGGVLAMTGTDYAAPYRGRYSTIRGGLRILRRDGFRDHIALAEHHLARKPVSFARPGDGAVVPVRGEMALGIVQGTRIYVLNQAGLALVPLTSAVAALEV